MSKEIKITRRKGGKSRRRENGQQKNKNLGKTIYRSYAKDTILLSTEQKKERKKN